MKGNSPPPPNKIVERPVETSRTTSLGMGGLISSSSFLILFFSLWGHIQQCSGLTNDNAITQGSLLARLKWEQEATCGTKDWTRVGRVQGKCISHCTASPALCFSDFNQLNRVTLSYRNQPVNPQDSFFFLLSFCLSSSLTMWISQARKCLLRWVLSLKLSENIIKWAGAFSAPLSFAAPR